jgi:broad specificity phosphatase PhoE
MDLYWVRHAESELNVDRRFVGGRSSWCELTERGRAQARALGREWVARQEDFGLIAVSTAVRAQQTARLAFEEAGVPLSRLEFWRELEETRYGDWEGAPRGEVFTRETISAYRAGAWGFRPPGGETLEEAAGRLKAWVDEVALGSGAERVVVVSHGMMIRCAVVALAGRPPGSVLDYEVPNTSVTHMRGGAQGWELVGGVADAGHLAGVGRLSGTLREGATRGTEHGGE